ncbi:MAG: ribose-5-phosphate isomerase [Flavobacteriales bacterium]|nr:ribose-5-phosphate isomerase [Flavobacteriales bacterium]
MLYRLYVIELNKKVFSENRKFREANPQFNGVLQCLYVGMTSRTPKERFEQHKGNVLSKKGHDISAAIVKKYGMYLRGSLFEHIDPMTKAEALNAEKALSQELRRSGYAVWSN